MRLDDTGATVDKPLPIARLIDEKPRKLKHRHDEIAEAQRELVRATLELKIKGLLDTKGLLATTTAPIGNFRLRVAFIGAVRQDARRRTFQERVLAAKRCQAPQAVRHPDGVGGGTQS